MKPTAMTDQFKCRKCNSRSFLIMKFKPDRQMNL